eukprot:2536639-Prymnesium_polylepis.1
MHTHAPPVPSPRPSPPHSKIHSLFQGPIQASPLGRAWVGVRSSEWRGAGGAHSPRVRGGGVGRSSLT